MNPKTLVALPAEKKGELRWRVEIDNVALRTWEALNRKTLYRKLASYELVIACPYFAGKAERDYGLVRKPVEQALHDYLWGGGNCIFLLPTQKYILERARKYVSKNDPRAAVVKHKDGLDHLAWEIIFSDTLGLIEYCLTSRQTPSGSVAFRELTLDQEIAYAVTGRALDALSRYLDKRAPRNPPYEIVLRITGIEPLACYSHNRAKYAAIRVAVGKRGTAILLPFDGKNVTREDIKLLLRLHTALRRRLPEEGGQIQTISEVENPRLSEATTKKEAVPGVVTEPIGRFSLPSHDVPEVSEVILGRDRIRVLTTKKHEFTIKAEYQSNLGRAARLLITHRLHDRHGAGYITIPKDRKVERLTYGTLKTAVSELNKKPGVCCEIEFFRSAQRNRDTGYEGWRFEPAPAFKVIDSHKTQPSEA